MVATPLTIKAFPLVLQGLQFAVSYEALERGLEIKQVSPRSASSRCPRCSYRLRDSSRVLYRTKCEFAGDRDAIACVNLFIGSSRCGMPGIASNAPKPDENPSGVREKQGKRDEVMKMISACINLNQS